MRPPAEALLAYTQPREASMVQNVHVLAPCGTRAYLMQALSSAAFPVIVADAPVRTQRSKDCVSVATVSSGWLPHRLPAAHFTVPLIRSRLTGFSGRGVNGFVTPDFLRICSYHCAAATPDSRL